VEAALAHHFAVAYPELKIGEARTLLLNEVAIRCSTTVGIRQAPPAKHLTMSSRASEGSVQGE
jgi:hypothetical protein